jgi:hypothetical protein
VITLEGKVTTLFLDRGGPLIRHSPKHGGSIHIHSLNPEREMIWRMSRGEMIRFAWRCLFAALRPQGRWWVGEGFAWWRVRR